MVVWRIPHQGIDVDLGALILPSSQNDEGPHQDSIVQGPNVGSAGQTDLRAMAAPKPTFVSNSPL